MTVTPHATELLSEKAQQILTIVPWFIAIIFLIALLPVVFEISHKRETNIRCKKMFFNTLCKIFDEKQTIHKKNSCD